MELFMKFTVPSVITSDVGTNFTDNLTTVFLNLTFCSQWLGLTLTLTKIAKDKKFQSVEKVSRQ